MHLLLSASGLCIYTKLNVPIYNIQVVTATTLVHTPSHSVVCIWLLHIHTLPSAYWQLRLLIQHLNKQLSPGALVASVLSSIHGECLH